MKFHRNLSWFLAVVGGVCLGAAVGFTQPTKEAGLPPIPARSPQELSIAFRDVAARTLPGVVSIRSVAKPKQLSTRTDRGRDAQQEELFRRFFGNDPRFDQYFNSPQMSPRREGAGSGFIVDSRGIVMTNSHVVEGADQVFVVMQDGREFPADSWHNDPRSDVAIVRFTPKEDLVVLPLGNSDQMQVGDWVLALGNPFGVGMSVTAGIISATGRGPGINEREQYLQTDAAINPGNSGGPLVNLYGEVVGINTAISTQSGGYDGIGFAIPANNARWIADQLIQDGKVTRSYLGVALQDLTNDLRSTLGLRNGHGALVGDVFKGSPADKAKIEPGDVILEFDGQVVTDRDKLVEIVERSAAGKNYKATVLRGGEQMTLSVNLEPMPDDYTAALRRNRTRESTEAQGGAENVGKLGLRATDLTEELAQGLGIDGPIQGVMVESVTAGGSAEQAGLRTGDVIQRVGTKPVKNLKEFGEALAAADLSQGILLHVKRASGSAFVVVKPAE